MAVRVLTSARTAIEATAGTAMGTATRLLYFEEGAHEQVVGNIIPTELRNSLIRSYRAYPGVETNEFSFSGDATYDDLAWWYTLAITAGVGTASGGSADKTWTFLPPTASGGTEVKTVTVEFGYADLISTVGWRVGGVYVDEFALKFEKDKAVTYSAKMLSFKGATQITAYTGTLSDRTNVTLTGPTTKVYVDASTIGTTADPKVMSVDWSVKHGWTRRYGLDNTSVAAEMLRGDTRETKMTLTRYFGDKTELDAFISKTARKVRVETVGAALGSSNYKHTLDFVGIPTEHKVSVSDGLIVAAITLDGIYDSTLTSDHKVTLVNSIAGPLT